MFKVCVLILGCGYAVSQPTPNDYEYLKVPLGTRKKIEFFQSLMDPFGQNACSNSQLDMLNKICNGALTRRRQATNDLDYQVPEIGQNNIFEIPQHIPRPTESLPRKVITIGANSLGFDTMDNIDPFEVKCARAKRIYQPSGSIDYPSNSLCGRRDCFPKIIHETRPISPFNEFKFGTSYNTGKIFDITDFTPMRWFDKLVVEPR